MTRDDGAEELDLWSTRDFPVLRATARLAEELGTPLMAEQIVDATGLAKAAVVRALVNLSHEHLDTVDASTIGERDRYVVAVLPAGLRAVGQWPSPETAVDRLIAALDEAIENAVEGSPRSSKLKAFRDTAASVSRDVLVEVMGGVLTGRIPM